MKYWGYPIIGIGPIKRGHIIDNCGDIAKNINGDTTNNIPGTTNTNECEYSQQCMGLQHITTSPGDAKSAKVGDISTTWILNNNNRKISSTNC